MRRQENSNGSEGVKYNLIPTETVKVSFDGADLPEKTVLFKICSLKVDHYITNVR